MPDHHPRFQTIAPKQELAISNDNIGDANVTDNKQIHNNDWSLRNWACKAVNWVPPRCRWDEANPPKFTLVLNLLFGFVSCIFDSESLLVTLGFVSISQYRVERCGVLLTMICTCPCLLLFLARSLSRSASYQRAAYLAQFPFTHVLSTAQFSEIVLLSMMPKD